MAQVTRLGLYGGPRPPQTFSVAPTSAVISGTVTSATEADIVAGGKTVIITLTNDTWAAAGTGPIGSTADTQAIIDGITSAQAEALGWNNEVRDKEVTTAVVRTSATVATITLTASPLYDITAIETITVTIPAAVLVTSAIDVVAAPTFTILLAVVVPVPTGGGGGAGSGVSSSGYVGP